MKNIVLCLSIAFLLAGGAFAQIIPAKVKAHLDQNYAGWKQAPGACAGSRWVLTGDFNGDGRTDYLVRILTGTNWRQRSLHLIGFINQRGDYVPDAFFEDEYSGDLTRSAVSIVKRGTPVDAGMGEEGGGDAIPLKNDAVSQYVCETDQVATYIFKDGEFKDIKSDVSLLDKPLVIPGPSAPTPLPSPVSNDKNDLTGTWALYQSNGDLTADAAIYIKKRGNNFDLIESFASGNMGSDDVGTIKNGRLVLEDASREAGTIDASGSTVSFPVGVKWVRKDRAVPPIFSIQPSDKWPFPTPNITGSWHLKMKDKPDQVGDKIEFFDQVGTSIKIRADGRIYQSFTAEDGVFIIEAMGAIQSDGYVIRLRGGNYLLKDGISKPVTYNPILEIPKLERQCQQMLNGKVVRDKMGNMVWGDKPDPLCTGTPDPVASVYCYKTQLQSGAEPEAAARTCSYVRKFTAQNLGLSDPTPVSPRPTVPAPVISDGVIPDLTGTYTVYDASGNVDKNTGTITYPGGTMTFKLSDGRAFSSATAYAKNGLITTGWGRNATVSADGQTIYWSNNTKWIRK